ncbi:MAG: tripartite tricarboxylate transporter TctB family protein [Rubrimonas sp.]|uniref:tripartite tricarboxylate transporter TctB family protein n=1 Tax=Rubrimonas sp. TaxID=2036015 RepID=UPI002FDD1319
MRVAEFVTALALMALSAMFMAYGLALPIGWEASSGPGGGAFPFWLSAAMFAIATAILIREWRSDPTSRYARTPFMHPESARPFLTVALSTIAAVALTTVAGVYVALPLFLLFHLRVFGKIGWITTAIMVLATPVVLFLFFEATLRIILPKGFTEPWFGPLYRLVF